MTKIMVLSIFSFSLVTKEEIIVTTLTMSHGCISINGIVWNRYSHLGIFWARRVPENSGKGFFVQQSISGKSARSEEMDAMDFWRISSVKNPLAGQTTAWLAFARFGCVFSEMHPIHIAQITQILSALKVTTQGCFPRLGNIPRENSTCRENHRPLLIFAANSDCWDF